AREAWASWRRVWAAGSPLRPADRRAPRERLETSKPIPVSALARLCAGAVRPGNTEGDVSALERVARRSSPHLPQAHERGSRRNLNCASIPLAEGSPLPDSNRRPPPYHRTRTDLRQSVATG